MKKLYCILSFFLMLFISCNIGAKDETKKYRVTYKSEFGIVPETITIEEGTILNESQLPKLTEETSEYNFIGWYDDNKQKAEAGIYKIIRDTTFYAKWEYTLAKSNITINVINESDINVKFETTNDSITFSAPQGYDSYIWFFEGDQISTDSIYILSTSSLGKDSYEVYLEAELNGKLYSYYAMVKKNDNLSETDIDDFENTSSICAIIYINFDNVARTILPVDTIKPEELSDFVLSGTQNGSEKVLSTWQNFNDINKTPTKIKPGNWTLKLKAQKGNYIYSAQTEAALDVGDNMISFNLIRNDDTEGFGSVNFTLDFSDAQHPENVKSAVAHIENLDGTKPIGFEPQSLEINNNYVNYKADNIPSGTYRMFVSLYADSNNNLILANYKEVLKIASNLESKRTHKLNTFKELFHINYHLNDSENSPAIFTESATETFTSYSGKIKLPALSRGKGWYFLNWYSDSELTNPISELDTSCCNDIDVYAGWDLGLTSFSITGNDELYIYDTCERTNQINTSHSIYEYYVEYKGNGVEITTEPLEESILVSIKNETSSIKDSSGEDIKITLTSNDKIKVYTIHAVRFFDCNSRECYEIIKNRTENINILYCAEEIDNYFYGSMNNNTYTVSLCLYNTKTIKAQAFQGCKGLVSIILPEELTEIGTEAFSDCSELNKVIIPANVKNIGESAFYGCKKISEISIPNEIHTINAGTFSYCTNLSKVTIPKSVTSIGNSAFSGCSSINAIIIPESVKNIGENAFRYCTGITEIAIPDGVHAINTGTFFKCTNLSKVTIPESITRIGKNAFYGCSSISEITIPENVTTIEDGAFYGCSGFTEITIPDGVHTINAETFSYCTNLSKVRIPENVTSIGNSAFSGCSSINAIIIPESVKNIGENAFRYCTGITEIAIPDGVHAINTGTFFKCTNLSKVTIPESITRIGKNAFYGCSSISEITIPENVTTIEDGAFYGCSGFTEITIPNSILSIGKNVFANCNNLSTIIFSGNIEQWCSINFSSSIISSLSKLIINNEEISKLTIPESVTSIGQFAFSGYKGLTEIKFPDNLISIGESAFSDCINLKDFSIPDSVENIGKSAFKNCTSLTKISIPSRVKKLESLVFFQCKGLTEVNLAYGIISIDGTFSSCSNLTKIIIPDSVTSLNSLAFGDCKNLTEVTLPYSLKYIGGMAFSGCQKLSIINYTGTIDQWCSIKFDLTPFMTDAKLIIDNEEITDVQLSKNITKIGNLVFSGYKWLRKVVISETVTSIGNSAFSSCPNLTEITIPSSVTYIGRRAFSDSKNLRINYSGSKSDFIKIQYYDIGINIIYCNDGELEL